MKTDKIHSIEQCPLAMTFSAYCAKTWIKWEFYGMSSQNLLWMMDSCLLCGKIIKTEQPIPHSKMSVLPLFLLFFLHSLITGIILLPCTTMRHQFLCHWELQISFELALEEMGGDRSGRRWRDKLMSMFELALTRSGRETTLGNLRDFQGQIAVF